MSKKYTTKKSIGDGGEHLVAYAFTTYFQWVYRHLPVDIGIDGEVEIIEKDISIGQFLKVQVKSTSDSTAYKTASGYSVSIYKDDIGYWKLLPFPVILCFVDLPNLKIYFRFIDSDLKIELTPHATQIVAFETLNILSAASKSVIEAGLKKFVSDKDESFKYFTPFAIMINEALDILDSMPVSEGWIRINMEKIAKVSELINALDLFKKNGAFWGETGQKIILKIEHLMDVYGHTRAETDVANNGSFS